MVFADFWALPPEANSFRLASGAGPAAHAGQLAGYQSVAASHTAAATQMAGTTAAALTAWDGLGALGMAETAAPLATWNAIVGAFAEKAAGTIGAAQAAYSAAMVSTVHYSVAIENRVQEAILESTDFLGVNAIPIAVNNAAYAEYWATNAAASTGYGAAAIPLIAALSIPLIPAPLGANPMGVAAAGAAVGAQAASAGVQALGAGLSYGSSAGTQALGAAAGVGAASGAAAAGASAGAGGSGAQGVGGQAGSTGSGSVAQPGAGEPVLSAAQGLAGPLLSAPASAVQSVTAPLTEGGSELMSGVGQFGGGLGGPLMSPAALGSSALGGGSGPGLSALRSGVPGAAGLGGGNGGFAGGGSAVTAALTKPTAGGAMAGPVGLPANWWSEPDTTTASAARVGSGAGGVGGAGAPGLYGLGAPAGRARSSSSGEASEADKRVVVSADDGGIPVVTDSGVVYVGGG